ncbi:hypothetical protein SAMN05216188_12695 [Lentzea xinjiangensis]|uniref:Uncharacterized protein n=1 Tax=Lentzea xinjiangensis TaxID=402600 RepID=A0A1H9VIQ4_9PSEU|nr:hypothetical protein [Lentzea xinjiangensis]SES21522.1 hypothetical protein SAMN05216188_12695 [Lentzea xinjiangensis]
MSTSPRQDSEQEYDDASRVSLEESSETDDADTVPGRSGSGSAHPEPNPTGNVGISDYSVSDDPDRG